jgi:hypothetical protein
MSATPVTEPNWLLIILSSAAVSATITVGWNFIAKLIDSHKEKKKQNHVHALIKLEIAYILERFAEDCSNTLASIEEILAEFSENHEEQSYDLKLPSISFEGEIEWKNLPVEFVAEVKDVFRDYNAVEYWMKSVWDISDHFDMWIYQKQRIALYGQRACELALKIRADIKVNARGDSMEFCKDHFELIINHYERSALKRSGKVDLIPDLRNLFIKRHPNLKKRITEEM